MSRTIDYFLAPISPWTYLGHQRFADLAARHGAQVRVKPIDLGKVFPVSGGLQLKDRAPQRQAYRLVELARWRDLLGMPLNINPRHFPVPQEPACRTIIAAQRQGDPAAMGVAGAILRACWAEERDVSDPGTLREIVGGQGLDADAVAALAATDPVKAIYDANTAEAIAGGVFGSPTYRIDNVLFWGQDRLDFVERALAS